MSDKHVDQEKLFRITDAVMRRYQRFLTVLRYGEGPHDAASDADHFGFIPSDPGYILKSLIKAKDLIHARTYPKFLDAGCGAGNIMLLADCVGFDTWGIERDPETIKLARKLTRSARIIEADLTKYRGYGGYDVIYYYQPMRSEKMEVFLDVLCSQMEVGAVVIPNGSSRRFNGDGRFKIYDGDHAYHVMYRKVKEV